MDKQILDKYDFEKKLGSGSFGEVYLVTDKLNKQKYAAKIEDRKKSSRLSDEYKIYERMYRKGFTSGIPKTFNFIESHKINVLVMELLNENLDKLFCQNKKKFKLETVLSLGINIIDLLENMHLLGYIHRDIKPNNFMIGFGKDKGKVFIMDMGLAKRYTLNGRHINLKTDKSLTGTARYASTNVHMGMEPSRRDDMESLGYMLIYFMKGVLPWQGIKKKKPNHMDIGEIKLCISLDKLCKDIPDCFKKYIQYCRSLTFEEKPDYDYLKDLFLDTARKMKMSLKYEWA